MTAPTTRTPPPSPWHPLVTSVATGVITKVFTDATPTPTGLMYGAVSGVVESFIPSDFKTAGIGQNVLSSAVSWGTSAALMNGAFKYFNKPILRVSPLTALGLAAGTELFNSATRDTVRKIR